MHAKALYSIFEKYYGIVACENKIELPDNYSLSLAYTPGVGECCMKIKENRDNAYLYTNKGNSIFVMTDSSGFADFDANKWNNYVPIPYLETTCIYYKTATNIDAYPLVLDYTKLKGTDDILEILVKLAPAYAGYELYKMSKETIKELKEKYNKLEKKPDVAIFTTEEADYLEYKIDQMNFKGTVYPKLVISAIFRAALDTRTFGFIDKALIDEILVSLKKEEDDKKIKDYFSLTYKMVTAAADYIIKNCKNSNKEVTTKEISLKFERFLIEGKKQWIEPLPEGYHSADHSINDNSLLLHKRFRGMTQVKSKIKIKDPRYLEELFAVDQIKVIADALKTNPELAHEITCKRNLSTIITNGTAVLGLGSIGAVEGLPVMEGKGCLFKKFGGIDLVPICIDELSSTKMTDLIEKILPIFASINLEDIKAPECFDIEQTLKKNYEFPIFHDDQHGTAVVTVAGLINALKLANKKIEDVKIVINGGGAAGISIIELLKETGAKNMVCCDTAGAIYKGRPKNMNKYKDIMADMTNLDKVPGSLADHLKGSDVFIGVSAPNCVSKEMVKSMKEKPIIFALSNPVPEIYPHEAKEAGAYIVATGRSDFPNQVNNCLAFPGIFRGVVDIRAKQITNKQKHAAAKAIAEIVLPEQLCPEFIIPNSLDFSAPMKVARLVAQAGIDEGLANRQTSSELVEDDLRNFLIEGTLRSLMKNTKTQGIIRTSSKDL